MINNHALLIFFVITILSLNFCKKEENRNGKNSEEQYKVDTIEQNSKGITGFRLISLGLGNTRESAKLDAQTFMAQQQTGILFSLSTDKITLKTPKTLLSNISKMSYKKLDDGKYLCVIYGEKQIDIRKAENAVKYRFKVSLNKFLSNSENYLMLAIKNTYKDEIEAGKPVSGKLFITQIKNIEKLQNINKKTWIEFVIVN